MDVAMATNFTVKIGKIGPFIVIRSQDIPKRITYSHSDFKNFICCTAHRRMSHYFTMDRYVFLQKVPLTLGESGPHLTYGT